MNAPLDAAVAPYVLTHTEHGVCRLTLNRGDRYNPLSRDMIAALQSEVARIGVDPTLRCVVLAAEGKGFCAGHDLKELREHPDLAWQQELFSACNALMVSLTALPQPVIARVHGIATAAGCQLVSMCDLAVAADTARFALPGVNVGVFCTTPAVGVARNVARKRAMEMLLTGEPIDAATALAWGLVNRVGPGAELERVTLDLAGRIVECGPAAIRLQKELIIRWRDTDLRAAIEAGIDAFARSYATDEPREAMRAYLEKRPPRFE
jgi:enoyl-CoA hydratase/carnithine racemase